MILNNRDKFFFASFFPICCVTFVRLHAVFGHGRENDLVFCGLKTSGAHFCKRLQIDDLDFLFMRLSWLVASSDDLDTATFDHGTFLEDIRMEVCGHIFG